jgi:hypothetical protein
MDVVGQPGDRGPGRTRWFRTAALVSTHLLLIVAAATLWQSGVLDWTVTAALSAAGAVGMACFVAQSHVHPSPKDRYGNGFNDRIS